MRYLGADGPEIELPRGDVTEGVVRVGDTVRRPHQPGSDAVAAYLEHLGAAGFAAAPAYRGIDRRDRDVFDFIPGDVAGQTLAPWVATDPILADVARLQRRLHDAGEGWHTALRFPRELSGGPTAALPAAPRLVSHNDITPQNVVFRAGRAVGLIDFDLAGWTTRLTDLATTCMHWVPLMDPTDRDPVFADVDVTARLHTFLLAYGLSADQVDEFLDAAHLRFAQTWATMHWRAVHLGGGWARMWDEGVGGLIERRLAWFERTRPILRGVVG
jgi:hypothetical protein